MSNGRIFCWGFVIASGLFAIAVMLGAERRFSGMEAIVGKALLAAQWGIISVALFGDRTKETPA